MRKLILILFLVSATSTWAQELLDIEVTQLQCLTDLTDCLDSIKTKTGASINYKSEALRNRPVRFNVEHSTLRKVLNTLCEESGTRYVIHQNELISIVPSNNNYFVHGYVVDASSKEVIANAEILVGNFRKVYTDQNGYFRIYTESQWVPLTIVKSQYRVLYQDIHVKQDQMVMIGLRPITTIEQVDVTYSDSGVLTLKQFDEVGIGDRILPSVGGEPDALGEIKILTGVQNVSFGDPGLIVRGGGPDQNFVVMDGIPVYNTFHLLGLYSIFNSSSVNSIKIYKDAFPSRYNSRLSSVIDVGLRNGNKKQHEIEADAGIVSSGISFNGPIVKDKLSYSLSARRTYADLLARPIQKAINSTNIQQQQTALWYYDLYGKIHYQVNEKNEIEVSGYNGGDQLNFNTQLQLRDALESREVTEGALGWRNKLGGVQWRSNISGKAVATFRSSVSQYDMMFSDEYGFSQSGRSYTNRSSYSNGIREWRSTADLDMFVNKRNHLQTGVGVVNYTFIPFERTYSRVTDVLRSDTTLISNRIQSQEIFAYVEDKAYFEGGNITLGMRFTRFSTGDANYLSLRPRVLIIQNIDDRKQLRFGLSTSNQFLHLIPNNNLGMPLDIWLPVTDKIKPMSVTQFSSRFDARLKRLRWSGAIFSKLYTNVVEYSGGSNLLLNQNWEESLLRGSGRSYGFELSMNTRVKDWDVYSAYTFNRSTRLVEGINHDQEYFSKYDRPHAINVLLEKEVSDYGKVLIAFTYASGNPVSLPSSRYVSLINGQEVIVEEFSDINNFRMPASHHLDVSYHHSRTHTKFTSTWVVGVYNLYNQLNPFMVYIGLNENANPTIKIRSYLPMMPMLKYSIKI